MKRLSKEYTYPVALIMMTDFLVTMIGQPDSYWSNFASVNEGSPIGFNLMRLNPAFFLLFCAIYLLIAIFLMRKLPILLGSTIALSLFLGHAYGSGTWIYHFFREANLTSTMFSGWYITIGYYVVVSFVAAFIVYLKRK